jgi:glutamate synthase (NADPH/NADH) large chain
MRTGRDVVLAAILGAEEFGFCTAALIVLGCVMLRHCHLNNCSVGVATQDELLEKRFGGKPEYLVNYFNFVAREARQIMASLGVRKIEELIGRTDLVEINRDILPKKKKKMDFSGLLYKPDMPKEVGVYFSRLQEHPIKDVLDRDLIKAAEPYFEKKEPVRYESWIANTDRATGAMLSGRLCGKFGERETADDSLYFKFKGVAGQSFGAWLAKGITFELEGLANDYVGKGISGGKIIIYPGKESDYSPESNILIGNTSFYGAIGGQAYIKGVAGERFCIRNSGLYAVVEGVGDHGCEYMTGGRVVVIGDTGRNFAAGMSGGIAYVYDVRKDFARRCNVDMAKLETPDEGDRELIYNLLHSHFKFTESKRAKAILDDLDSEIKKFVKVMPIEYKRILEGAALNEKFNPAEASDG